MNSKITFDDLLNSVVSKDGQLSKTFARRFIKEMASIIEEGLIRDGVVHVSDLGIFKLNEVPARSIRNIQSGEMMEVPPKKRVMFKPENTLRKIINKQFEQLQPQIIEETKTEQKNEVKKEFFSSAFADVSDKEVEKISVEKQEQEEKAKEPEKTVLANEQKITEEKINQPAASINKNRELSKEEEKKNRLPIYMAIIAVLVIIFLIIQFGSDDDESEMVNEISPKPALDTVAKVTEQKPEPQKESAAEQKKINHQTNSGDNLWRLARTYYNDAYLWPLIYKYNQKKISDPDFIRPGITLEVPKIAEPQNLKEDEEKLLTEGHLMAYRAYKKTKPEAALNHLFVANELNPGLVSKSISSADRNDLNKVITMNR